MPSTLAITEESLLQDGLMYKLNMITMTFENELLSR